MTKSHLSSIAGEQPFPHPERVLTTDSLPASERWWKSRELYVRMSRPALVLYSLTAALSIGLTQVILIPLVVYWAAVAAFSGKGRGLVRESFRHDPLVPAVAWWFTLCAISGAWGADSIHSFSETVKSGVFLLLPFAVASAITWHSKTAGGVLRFVLQLLSGLVLGQTVAAIHSVLQLGAGLPLPDKIPGAVTESGQLTLIAPLCIGFMLFGRERFARKSWQGGPANWIYLAFIAVMLAAWPFANTPSAGGTAVTLAAATACFLATAFLVYQMSRKGPEIALWLRDGAPLSPLVIRQVFFAAAILLGTAVLFNLKRGPWLGILVEVFVFGMIFSRRLVYSALGAALIILLVLAPVRARLGGSLEDFSIQGGRQNMWAMGLELVQSYPLGIGFGNSRLMRVLDPTLPERHRHMHNNVLQVAVETGWLGLGGYMWWMLTAFLLGVSVWKRGKDETDETKKSLSLIAFSLCVALLGWQCAGVVEYNFGDAEIRLIALFYMGLLLAINRTQKPSSATH